MTFDSIINNHKRTPLSDEEINILKKNGYRFDDYTPDRIRYNMDMILYMLEKDSSLVDLYDSYTLKTFKNASPYSMYRLFKFLDENYLPYDHIPGVEIYETAKGYSEIEEMFISLTVCKNLKNCNLRTTSFEKITQMRDLEWYWKYAFMDEEKRQVIIQALKKNKIPASILPNELLTDPLVIEAYTSSFDPYTQECILRALTEKEHIPHIEENFALAYGVESVEEYINKYIVCYNPKETSDIENLAAVKIYVHKLLSKHNVKNVDVVLNIFANDIDDYGYYRDGCVFLATYPTRDYEEMVKVAAHETFHAIQFENIVTLNIEDEPDIDTYTKDIFLRDFYNISKQMDYYAENYSNITTEYDAEYRAKIEFYNIGNIGNEETTFDSLRATIEERQEEEKEILRNLSYETAYSYTRTRVNERGSRVHLDDLVRDKLIEYRDKHQDFEHFMEKIVKLYPMLYYEYHISENDIHKKTPEELLTDLELSKDLISTRIYTGLIKSSINPLKDKDYDQNIEYYKQVIAHPDTPHYIRRTIQKSLDEEEQSKYLGLIKLDSYDI